MYINEIPEWQQNMERTHVETFAVCVHACASLCGTCLHVLSVCSAKLVSLRLHLREGSLFMYSRQVQGRDTPITSVSGCLFCFSSWFPPLFLYRVVKPVQAGRGPALKIRISLLPTLTCTSES